MPSSRRLLVLALVAASLALLVPGVTRPMFTLVGSFEKEQISATAKTMIADTMVARGASQPGAKPEAERRAAAEGTIASMMKMFGIDNLSGRIEAYRKTRSVIGAVRELFDSGHAVVAFLVMLFSVVIPVTKIGMQLAGAFTPNHRLRRALFGVSGAISKWSMADVFVVAIVVAYLAANASSDMDELVVLNAHFEHGFYLFLGYCLFSVASSQVIAASVKTPGAGEASDPT
jgi:hypothetical protein